MSGSLHTAGILVTAWAVIFALRALPFILCARVRRENTALRAAEKWLSPLVIALLVVFSYSGLAWQTSAPYLAGALVVAVQLCLRNGLVAILAGTALYMALI